LYRKAGERAGHRSEDLKVGVHALGFIGETSREAEDLFFPGWQAMFTKIGSERGWAPATRQQFDALV
jgi:alkanesulfonate monooxygenase SsuD/methylene tetrahydromethanopterin reductase-like flavin-dependent oxidoreductase (luciferase family)